MKRSWILGLLVAAAIGLLIAWIARNTYWDYESTPTAPKGEAAANPFYAAQRFVEALGGQPERRMVMGALPDDAVVVLSFWHWSLIENRRRQLERWVESGGRLVVGPALIGGETELEQWAGLARESEEDEEEENASPQDADQPGFESKNEECTTLKLERSASPAPRDEYRVCRLEPGTWLTSHRASVWSLRNEVGTQAVRVEVGEGSVTMLNVSPFGNRDLTNQDHGALFVAATQMHRGDRVIFLSEEERASLLSLIWTYGAPVVLLSLLLLAVALWRSGVRFGPLAAAPDSSRRSIVEQIRGTGQFMARFGNQTLHGAMIRAVHETAQRHIPGYARLPADERVRAIAQLSGADPETLAEIINYGGARRPGDLRNAIAALELTRRRILEATDKKGNRHAS